MIVNQELFLQNILQFPHLLRQAGLPVSPEQSIAFVQALALVDLGSRPQVFHAGRSLLITRQEHLRLYETIFNRFWRAVADPAGAAGSPSPPVRRDQPPAPFNIATYMAYRARPADEPLDLADRSQTYSPAERLQNKLFAEMTPEELAAVKRLMQSMQWEITWRESRRRVPDRRGDVLNLRRAMRSAGKYGGVPLELFWQQRKVKQRPLILIADISGSMEKYARLMLQFFYSISHRFKEVESFVFGTRLTRITHQLKVKNIDLAIDEAGRDVLDWSGGTRIGDSLRAFNQQWSRRVLRRGAIVLIVSDGWERGDVAGLRREMRYLQHRCHRLIWLNPLLGQPGYQPLVEGMAAALPYVDDFLPVHNLQSLSALSQHLGSLGRRRAAPSGGRRRPVAG